jgi:thiol-disulfide isomerase/thioredoxin
MRTVVMVAASLALTAMVVAHPSGVGQGTTRAAGTEGAAPAAGQSEGAALLQEIKTGLAEPKSDERNARLEQLVGRLDALPDAAAFDQKFAAHQRMGAFYRGDDNNAGLLRHAGWIIDAAKTCTPDQRKQYASSIVNAYLDVAQAWAGQALPDRALALLRRAPADLPDIPTVARSVKADLDRLELVGTAAAPITAPRWLNVPAGTTTLDLAHDGQVTLLEFSAHWCVPCKKSYPTANRLRERFGSRGFRVVLATQLYGFFERETSVTPAAEIEHDRAYFASHQLDVPIAIAAQGSNDDDPNMQHYRVEGIPQIQIIDRHGVIRLVMVGFDEQNEGPLTKLVEALLDEKD